MLPALPPSEPVGSDSTHVDSTSPVVRPSHVPRLAKPVLASGLALVLLMGTMSTAVAEPGAPADSPVAAPGRYIVSLADAPVATYEGDVRGLRSTRPESGRKVDVTSSAAKAYRTYLGQEQDKVAARVGVKKTRSFSVTLNAFTADLTSAQVTTLKRTAGVVAVSKDTLRKATDDKNSTDFLRLTGKGGVWSSLGGKAKAGRGVVVGVLDTGIWPENKSFAGTKLGTAAPTSADPYRPYRSGGKIVMKKSDGSTFTGTCQSGDEFTASLCNTKLVGARYFSTAFEASVPPADRLDYLSPRDGGGHGSHTASTAAGNAGVAASVDGVAFGNISGVAPAAKIAAYKVLWEGRTAEQTGGFTSDIVAGIDAAVSDGVDVLNYSIGSTQESSQVDPIALAFLSASSAGVFVAASAGNSGPGASTLDNATPWITTVAASTVAPYEATATLGNGKAYAGISTTVKASTGSKSLVNAAAVKAASATDANAALCAPNTLDSGKAAGTIVVCDRGVVDRVAKSAEVKRAGGVGMILVNLTENSLDGDVHTIPTVHLNPPASAAVKTYAATSGAKVTLAPGNTTSVKIPYPQIASFSSRGPSLGSGGDTLKPDIAAPGVSILAAVAPPSNSGRDYDFYSGTSMAAPHIAGLAALYLGKGVHPNWSPMRIKSALMTTAGNTVDSAGKANTDPFSQGAGQVDPSRMFNPALVYTSNGNQWLRYLEGLGYDTQTGLKAVDPSDLNAASIAVGSLLGTQTITRKVTSVKAGLYRASVSVPGVKATVSPSILSFNAPGETKTFKVTLRRTSAAYDEAATGFLTWKGANTTVRSPIAVTPTELTAPAVVTGTGTSGSTSFAVTPGSNGPFPIKGFGLSTGTSVSATTTKVDTTSYSMVVPAGAKVAQASVRSSVPGADIDLSVYGKNADGTEVLLGQSATETANETVQLVAPAAGTYRVEVKGYAEGPGTTSTPYVYTPAVVTKAEGNLTVTPANPTGVAQKPITVKAAWTGLKAGATYAGWVEYENGTGTVLTVN